MPKKKKLYGKQRHKFNRQHPRKSNGKFKQKG